jgi:hypothetical protein
MSDKQQAASEFFANAAKAYIDQVKNQSFTDSLNKVYSENRKEFHLSKELSTMQASSIPDEKW